MCWKLDIVGVSFPFTACIRTGPTVKLVVPARSENRKTMRES